MNRKEIEEEAMAYSDKYNLTPPFGDEDFNHDIESPKYSCDGCDQNKKALYQAVLHGVMLGARIGFEAGQSSSVAYFKNEGVKATVESDVEDFLKTIKGEE